MNLPYIQDINRTRNFIDTFGGLNRKISIEENEFSDLCNMSADNYPLLAPRKKRLTIKKFPKTEEVRGFSVKEAVVYVSKVNGVNQLFVNGNQVTSNGDLLTDDTERQFVSMGCRTIVFPDKFFVNLLDTSEKGHLENKIKIEGDFSQSPISLFPCTADGSAYTDAAVSSAEPNEKTNGMVWVDTSGEKSIYKIWDESTKQWAQVSATYIKLSRPNIGKGFSKWDGISITGLSAPEGSSGRIQNQIKALNQSGVIVFDQNDDYLVIAGLLEKATDITSGTVTLERKVPEMDFVIESNNRLWGCRYGLQGDKTVNEIYASKLGDFKNWNAFFGLSTDSYALSLGSDGRFTGAITYLGYPVFFKERCVHKIYGTLPSNYQLITTECRGVARGSEKSLAIVNNILFYHSPIDFCAFDGSLPESISENLGDVIYSSCIAGGVNDKLFVSAMRADGERETLVFDTKKGIWHKESAQEVISFQKDGHVLYYLFKAKDGTYSIKAVDEKFNTVISIETPEKEEDFSWYAESGNIGYYTENHKYVQKIIIRASIGEKAYFALSVSYDDGKFESVLSARKKSGISSFKFPVKLRRCDHFKLRFEGEGDVKFISISKTLIVGSDES